MGRGQGGVSVHVDLREAELRLRLPQLTLGLVEGRLKWTRVNFEKDLVLLDLRTFTIILANQVAVRLRLDLRVDIAVKRSNPLSGHGHIPLICLDYSDRHRSRRGGTSRGFDLVAPREQASAKKQH